MFKFAANLSVNVSFFILQSSILVSVKNDIPSSKMVARHTARTVIGIIGNVISFGLFLSPIPTFLKIWKHKAVDNFKPDPYVATVLNCLMWTFYGLPFVHPDSILIVTINSTGLVMEIIYVSIFFIYAPWTTRKKMLICLLVEVIFFAIVVFVTLNFVHTTKNRSMVVGVLCIIFNVIMYTSPLTVARMVIKTKSVKYMPFSLSLASFCNGITWAVYALLKFDIYVLIPNSLGAISGFAQLVLYACYYKSADTTNDDQNLSEIQISKV